MRTFRGLVSSMTMIGFLFICNVASALGTEVTVPGSVCHQSNEEGNVVYRYYNGNFHNMEATNGTNFYVECPIPYIVDSGEDGDYVQPSIYVYDPSSDYSVGVDCTIYTTNFTGSQIDYSYASTDEMNTTGDNHDFVGWTTLAPWSGLDSQMPWEFDTLVEVNGGVGGDKITAYCYLTRKDDTSYGGGIGAIALALTYY
jgi:hypothetical protein